MRKQVIAISILFVIAILVSLFVLAQPNRVPATNNKAKEPVPVVIPANAVQVADGVFSLGTARDVDGNIVEGIMFVDYKKGYAKPPWAGGGGGGTTTTTCFSLMAKGAKWKTLEPWVVNPTNTEGLGDSFVLTNLAADIQKWEDASSTNILGNGSINTSVLVADETSPDGVNEVYFGDVDSAGTIAVTIVWGIFGGPPSQRKLVEWDQVYDEVDFNWSSTGEANKMDFENIATHEIGHSVGMGHPPDGCVNETMYRFATEGETKKRDLNAGDTAGINDLY
ncbi:MAG: matrixin family metalloprotease [Nanoarchaeota archaeon]